MAVNLLSRWTDEAMAGAGDQARRYLKFSRHRQQMGRILGALDTPFRTASSQACSLSWRRRFEASQTSGLNQ